MVTILVVDDELMIRDLLWAVLARHGHEVLTACSRIDGLELFQEPSPADRARLQRLFRE